MKETLYLKDIIRDDNESIKTEENEKKIIEPFKTFTYDFILRDSYSSTPKNEILVVAYNTRQKMFVFLNENDLTTWEWKKFDVNSKIKRVKTFDFDSLKKKLNYVNIIYCSKYDCYFALRADNALLIINREFEEVSWITNPASRTFLSLTYNPINDELITSDLDGLKIWCLVRDNERAKNVMRRNLKYIFNYKLILKNTFNFSTSYIKRIEIDTKNCQFYCCSNLDLFIYDFNGKLIRHYEETHRKPITCCCYSLTAKSVITGSYDNDIKVWSFIGGLLCTFRGHSKAITKLLLSPTNSNLLISSSLDGFIKIWSLDIMKQIFQFNLDDREILSMGFTNENYLYVSSASLVEIFIMQNFVEFWSNTSERITKIWSNNIKNPKLLTFSDENTIRLYNANTASQITMISPIPILSSKIKVVSIAYSRSSDTIYILLSNFEIWIYYTKSNPSNQIAVWDVLYIQQTIEHKEQIATEQKHNVNKNSILKTYRAIEFGITQSTKSEVSICRCVGVLDSTVNYWNLSGLYTPSVESFLMLGLESGTILFMDTLVKNRKYFTLKCSKDPITEIKHDTLNNSLVVKIEMKHIYHIQYWSLPDFQLKYQAFCSRSMTSFARLNDFILFGFENGNLNLVQLEPCTDFKLKLPNDVEMSQIINLDTSKLDHRKNVLSVDVCNDLELFMSSSSDGVIKIWNSNKNLICEINLNDEITFCCFLNSLGDLIFGWRENLFKISLVNLIRELRNKNKHKDDNTLVFDDNLSEESLIIEDDEIKFDNPANQIDKVIQMDLEKYLRPFNIYLDKEKITFSARENTNNDAITNKKKQLQFSDLATINTNIAKTRVYVSSELSSIHTDSFMSNDAPSITFSSPRENPLDEIEKVDLTLTVKTSELDIKACLVDLITQYHVKTEQEFPANWSSFPRFGQSPRSTPSCTPPLLSPREQFTEIEVKEKVLEKNVETEPAKEGFKLTRLKLPNEAELEEELEKKLKERLPDPYKTSALKNVKINSKTLIDKYHDELAKKRAQHQHSHSHNKTQQPVINQNIIYRSTRKRSKTLFTSTPNKMFNDANSSYLNSNKDLGNCSDITSKSNYEQNGSKRKVKTRKTKSSRRKSIFSTNSYKSTVSNTNSLIKLASSETWATESDLNKKQQENELSLKEKSSISNYYIQNYYDDLLNWDTNNQTTFAKTSEEERKIKIQRLEILASMQLRLEDTKIKEIFFDKALTETEFRNKLEAYRARKLIEFKYGMQGTPKRIASATYKLPFEFQQSKVKQNNSNKLTQQKDSKVNSDEETKLASQHFDKDIKIDDDGIVCIVKDDASSNNSNNSNSQFRPPLLFEWLQNYEYQRNKLNRRVNKVKNRQEVIFNENLKKWTESIAKKDQIIKRSNSAKQLLPFDVNKRINSQTDLTVITKNENAEEDTNKNCFDRQTKSANVFRMKENSNELASASTSNVKVNKTKSVSFAFNNNTNSSKPNQRLETNHENTENQVLKPIIHIQPSYLVSQIEMEEILSEVEQRIQIEKRKNKIKESSEYSFKSIESNESIRNKRIHFNASPFSYQDIAEISDSDFGYDSLASTSNINTFKTSLRGSGNIRRQISASSAKTKSSYSSKDTNNVEQMKLIKLKQQTDQDANSLLTTLHRLSFKSFQRGENIPSSISNSSKNIFIKLPLERSRTPPSIPLNYPDSPTRSSTTTQTRAGSSMASSSLNNYPKLHLEYRLPNTLEKCLLSIRFPIMYKNIIESLNNLNLI